MRVRAMSLTGDFTFGQGSANFLVNTPEAVAQLAQTRLGLWTGQSFVDLTAGMPWSTEVLRKGRPRFRLTVLWKSSIFAAMWPWSW